MSRLRSAVEKVWPFVVAGTVLVVVAGGTIAACSSGDKTHNDTRPSDITTIGGKRFTFNNADDYPNVTAFCIGEDGMYTTTRDAGVPLVVVPSDLNCAEGGILYAP